MNINDTFKALSMPLPKDRGCENCVHHELFSHAHDDIKRTSEEDQIVDNCMDCNEAGLLLGYYHDYWVYNGSK